MMTRLLAATSLAALLAAGAAAAAPRPSASQPLSTAAQAPAQQLPPLVQGPPIPGFCIFSRDGAIASSSAGKALLARMQQLRAQAAAEIQAEQTALKTDADALMAKRASLSQEQLQAQAAPLQQRQEATARKAEQRNAELEATGEKALARFETAINPILRNLYQQQHCSVLMRSEAVMAANTAMDLTPAAVQQLNATMPTMTFDRETLPAR